MTFLSRWLPVAAMAAVIFYLSTNSFSGGHTMQSLYPVLRWLFPNASMVTLETIHLAIRKSAHITEYFIFSLLLWRAIRAQRSGWKLDWALTAIAIAAAYGASDEIHQIFVPDRGPSVVDAMIDTCGASLAQIALWLWFRWQGNRAVAAAAATRLS
jgi:VanZ family protein